MKLRWLFTVVLLVFLYSTSNVLASYPYEGSCPAPGVYVVDEWSFYKCECTSYVAWKLNLYTEQTDPLFSNSYQDEHWGNASNWKSLVDDETYAHYSQDIEYLDPSAQSYPYKSYGNGGVFDVTVCF